MAKGKKKDKDKKKKAKDRLDELGASVENTSKAMKKAAKKAKKEAQAKAQEAAAQAQDVAEKAHDLAAKAQDTVVTKAKDVIADAQANIAQVTKPKHAAGHWPEETSDEPKAQDAKQAEATTEAAHAAASEPKAVPKSKPEPKPQHESKKAPQTLEMPDEDKLFALAALFKIFGDPTRLRILFSLAAGPKCVADISQAAQVTQGATSHQLRSMKQEHLVDFVRDGKQVIYSLADERVEALLAQGLSYISE